MLAGLQSSGRPQIRQDVAVSSWDFEGIRFYSSSSKWSTAVVTILGHCGTKSARSYIAVRAAMCVAACDSKRVDFFSGAGDIAFKNETVANMKNR